MPFSSITTIPPIWFENYLTEFLRANVAVVIPLFILFLKIVVLRITGDVEELIHSLVIMPMEVLLVALGFIFAGLARTIPFESQFPTDTKKDLAGTILIFAVSLILMVMYRVNKRAITYFERFSVAVQHAKLQDQQKLVFINAETSAWKTAWAAAYLLAATLIWLCNMAFATLVLWQTLLRIK